MTEQVPVIDLFSGPGGLAEGFSPCNIPEEKRRYKIVLSVEKEQYAYDTLLLRAFLRQFDSGLPLGYYKFLNGFCSLSQTGSVYILTNGRLLAKKQNAGTG